MFKGIISNAGAYRESSDALNGRVEFGLPIKKLNDKGECSNSRYSGINPLEIEQGVLKATEELIFGAADPISNAAKFYQQFVRIHPFYDGNGRIGRFLVETYLLFHGYYVHWETMKRNSQWIRQLNYCHRKMTPQTMTTSYPFAVKWWVHHFKKFVFKLELAPEEQVEW